MQYNVKVLNYADNRQQLRLYSYDIINDFREETKKRKKEVRDKTKQEEEHILEVSKNRTINTIYELSRSNHWDYFITMTFNPQRVNSYDLDDCYECIKKYLQYIRRNYCKDLIYLVVPEKHISGRYHIHGLIGNADNIPKTIANYNGYELKDGHGRIIYNLPDYIYGFSTATVVTDNFAVCHYITKYCCKELQTETKNKRRYLVSKNINRPVEEVIKLNQEEINHLIEMNRDKILFSKTLDYNNETVQYIEFENLNKIYDFKNINGCPFGG